MLHEAPVDAAGNVDYVFFSHILKHGAKKEPIELDIDNNNHGLA